MRPALACAAVTVLACLIACGGGTPRPRQKAAPAPVVVEPPKKEREKAAPLEDVTSLGPKTDNDLAHDWAKYGQPDSDYSNEKVAVRPVGVTRTITYKAEGVMILYFGCNRKGANESGPPPYSRWDRMAAFDVSTGQELTPEKFNRRMANRRGPTPPTSSPPVSAPLDPRR